jgi:hypothetical protein
MKLTDENLRDIKDAMAFNVSPWDIPTPDTIYAMAKEVLEIRALLASLQDEDWLEEIIADSIDLDWTPRTAARAIVRAMKGKWTPDQWLGYGKVD